MRGQRGQRVGDREGCVATKMGRTTAVGQEEEEMEIRGAKIQPVSLLLTF